MYSRAYLMSPARCNFLAHELRLHAQADARTLNDRTAGHGVPTHDQGKSHHSVISDDRDFRRRSVLHDIQQRDDGRERKVNMRQPTPRLVKDLPELLMGTPSIMPDPTASLRYRTWDSYVESSYCARSVPHPFRPRYKAICERVTDGRHASRHLCVIVLPLGTPASGRIDAKVFLWTAGKALEMVMYIGGILGTILIIALIIFLVRRI